MILCSTELLTSDKTRNNVHSGIFILCLHNVCEESSKLDI